MLEKEEFMGLFSSLIDLYENTRKTKTDKKDNKSSARNYNFDGGFTGDRKTDITTPRVQVSEKKQITKDDGEER